MSPADTTSFALPPDTKCVVCGAKAERLYRWGAMCAPCSVESYGTDS
jgi:hypothetical protein